MRHDSLRVVMERLETTVACECVALAFRADIASRRGEDWGTVLACVEQSPEAIHASVVESLRIMRDRGEI